MSTFDTMNGFPTGAEPGGQIWTSFWDDESVGVTPGTRITTEDLMPIQNQDFEAARGHVITAAGTLSVEAWLTSFATDTDSPQLY